MKIKTCVFCKTGPQIEVVTLHPLTLRQRCKCGRFQTAVYLDQRLSDMADSWNAVCQEKISTASS